jgi:excisionase family DNA binding protein
MHTHGHTYSHTAERLLTFPEVAERLSCSTRSVSRWITAAGLPVIHLGSGQRSKRVSEADLAAWIESRKAAA